MKKVVSLLLMMIFVIGILSGCKAEKREISIYFKNGVSNELNAETRLVEAAEKTGAAEIAKLAVAEIIKGPQNEKNAPVIDSKAKLLSLVVNENVATVNMSKHYARKKGVEGLLLRFAFVNTLCSIDGIEGIVIQVEGKPIVSDSTGKEFGVLGISDIAQNTENKTLVKLYFPDKAGDKLVLEKRMVDTQQAFSPEKTVVSELIKGPSDSKLSGAIPEGTKLLNIETKDNVCYVNFSTEFKTKTASGSASTTLALYSVVNSLCELESVESVQILINGEAGVEFGNYLLDIPYEADKNFIEG